MRRKKTPSHWPPWVFAGGLVVLILSGLAVQKIVSMGTVFATVVEPELSTRTGPSLDNPTLSALEEGALVVVLKSHQNWLQIQLNSDLPGWVPADKVISTKAIY